MTVPKTGYSITRDPRILLVDSYDSFTHNLSALCSEAISSCKIHIVKNDEISSKDFPRILPYFDAVIVGPGPGSPDKDEDIRIVKHLWTVQYDLLLPVFGVCLGLQSLAIEHGASLKRLNTVKHGQVSRLEVLQHARAEGGLFQDVGEVHAVRYHSLHVQLQEDGPIEALAYANDGAENGRVVMAARHKSKPFWAVQYHPESTRTRGGGVDVVANFWKLAREWSTLHGRQARSWNMSVQSICPNIWPRVRDPTALHFPPPTYSVETSVLDASGIGMDAVSICEVLGVYTESSPFVLLDSAARPGRFSIIGCLDESSERMSFYLGDTFVTVTRGTRSTRFTLDGSIDIWTWIQRYMKERRGYGGNTTIPFWGGLVGYLSYELGVRELGVALPDRPRGDGHPDVNLIFVERSVVLDNHTKRIYVQSIRSDDSAWLAQTARKLRKAVWTGAPSSPSKTPSGISDDILQTFQIPTKSCYISAIDECKAYLASGDSYELCLTAQTRFHLSPPPASIYPDGLLHPHPSPSSLRPSSSWILYKRLRTFNPAPHSAYLRLSPSTVISSSPERFLSFTRPLQSNRSVFSPTWTSDAAAPSIPTHASVFQTLQLRPIKGTLRKAPDIDRAEAEHRLRGSTKEVAENLMIVDLIRHDLYGVVGPKVEVKQFCVVEEYETVWQMVSVIEGTVPAPTSTSANAFDGSGWEALKRSLPPGSMTGAPKKRSVELLQRIEAGISLAGVSTGASSGTQVHSSHNGRRGLYSGVLGYWDVGGGGDWSVVIRSCFKHDGSPRPSPSTDLDVVPDCETLPPNGPTHVSARATAGAENEELEEWVVGAGGAITALSDPEDEWDEMCVKLQALLRAFNGRETAVTGLLTL